MYRGIFAVYRINNIYVGRYHSPVYNIYRYLRVQHRRLTAYMFSRVTDENIFFNPMCIGIGIIYRYNTNNTTIRATPDDVHRETNRK